MGNKGNNFKFRLVGRVEVKGAREFSLKEKLQVGKQVGEIDGVKIVGIGPTLSGILNRVEVERDVAPAMIRIHEALEPVSDNVLVLAGLVSSEMKSKFFWDILEKHASGKDVGLITTGEMANTTFIMSNGICIPIGAYWCTNGKGGKGWFFDAHRFLCGVALPQGVHVISC